MESIWSRTYSLRKKDALHSDVAADAAVIGGGMAGILTAYQLERAGMRTVVLEAERIGSGQTKGTTAKITSQHGMFCRSFIEKKGIDTAEKYVRANQEAVEEFKRLYSGKRLTVIWKKPLPMSILITRKSLFRKVRLQGNSASAHLWKRR